METCKIITLCQWLSNCINWNTLSGCLHSQSVCRYPTWGCDGKIFPLFRFQKPCFIDIALCFWICNLLLAILTSQHTPYIYLYLFEFQIKATWVFSFGQQVDTNTSANTTPMLSITIQITKKKRTSPQLFWNLFHQFELIQRLIKNTDTCAHSRRKGWGDGAGKPFYKVKYLLNSRLICKITPPLFYLSWNLAVYLF